MTPLRFEQIRQLFFKVRALDASQRSAQLERTMAEDADLANELKRLLEADQNSSFLESPLIGPAAVRDILTPPDIERQSDLSTQIRTAESSLRIGDSVGSYRIVQLIGEGGMGTVYKAQQFNPIVRSVALKVIKWGMDTREVIARFESERQALALMDHPNIARVLDAGSTEAGRPYFVMELVDGKPITEYARTHALTIDQRLDLVDQACQAVQHAHQKGVIHRDLKPSNLLVSDSDGRARLKIIDFGIAKAIQAESRDVSTLTLAGQLLGTPAYMSPEQIVSQTNVDTRADIYSLGVILYELLTGTTPFDTSAWIERGMAEMQHLIREVEPPTPSDRIRDGLHPSEPQTVSGKTRPAGRKSAHSPIAADPAIRRSFHRQVRGELDWIVLRAMDKIPARRYASAAEFAADIQRHRTNQPVQAGPPGSLYRLQKMFRRHRGAFAGISALVLTLVTALAVTLHYYAISTEALRRAEKERDRAQRASDFVTETLSGARPAVAAGKDPAILIELMEKAAARVRAGEMADSPRLEFDLRLWIAYTLRDLGRLDGARDIAAPAVELARKTFGARASQVFDALAQLANTMKDQGEITQALALHHEALEIAEYSGTHAQVTDALNNIGQCLQYQKRFLEALPYHERSVQIARSHGAVSKLQRGQSLAGLSSCLRDLGRLDEAEPLAKESLELISEVGDRREQLVAQVNLGILLCEKERYAEAWPYLDAARTEARAIYRTDHVNLADALLYAAVCETGLGRNERVEEHFLEAMEMFERLFLGGNPRVTIAAMRLANYYLLVANRPDMAHSYYNRVARDVDSGVTMDPFSETALWLNFGKSAAWQGHPEEAVVWFRKSVESATPSVPPDYAAIPRSLDSLAACLDVMQCEEEAAVQYSANVHYCDATRAPLDGDRALAHFNLAVFALSRRRFDEAYDHFSVAAEIDAVNLGTDSYDWANTQTGRAVALLRGGRTAPAAELLADLRQRFAMRADVPAGLLEKWEKMEGALKEQNDRVTQEPLHTEPD